ncbi:hypothetical protein DOY81_015514, partial [Sarcophaga bullata]
MARSLLESIIPAIVSLFIGPWSDKFGRRPIVLTTFTGYLAGSIILTTLTYISTKVAISPWVFLLSSSKIREFFRFDLVKDLIQTCIKRRPNFDRIIIWLTMLALTVAIFTMEGDSNVTYLYVRKQFEWTLKDYSMFNAARIVVQIIGSILGMFILRRIFKFSIVTMT